MNYRHVINPQSILIWFLPFQQRSQITIQFNSLQVEFDQLTARYEEEAEAAGNLRATVNKLQIDLQNLRSKYDKDMAARLEELEDLRLVLIRQCLRNPSC